MNQKQISLCADDFGLNPGISEGILDLVALSRLSAVSCMTNSPAFQAYAPSLFAFKNQIQTGLHFNLTEGFFLSEPERACMSLKELLIKAQLRLLSPQLLSKELNAQLDCFIHHRGEEPDFIDGHQHIHQFPQIREVVFQVYEQRLRKKGTLIRATVPSVGLAPYLFKTKMIALTGGRTLKKRLLSSKIPHNSSFAGIYDFAAATDYGSLFRQWLAKLPHLSLIMCHPGKPDPAQDLIASARIAEFNYFLSNAFLSDCLQHQVNLSLK